MFINNLRQRRLALGLSQTKVARLANLPEPTLSDLELGKRQPWHKARADLAKVLGVPEEELFPETQKREE